jgi:DNA-binding transcriptional LysR family regulator
LFAPDLKSGAVISALRDWLSPPVDLWAVFPTGRLVSAKARAFASFIESQMTIDGFRVVGLQQE